MPHHYQMYLVKIQESNLPGPHSLYFPEVFTSDFRILGTRKYDMPSLPCNIILRTERGACFCFDIFVAFLNARIEDQSRIPKKEHL